MKIKNEKLLLLGIFLTLFFLGTFFYGVYKILSEYGKVKVAVLEIKGTISYDSQELDVECIINKIKEINNSYPYLILEIDSPGGSATEVKRIVNYLDEFNGTKIAYIRKIGTSGAYWIAASSDYIIAEPYSIVGSIGVSFSYLSGEGLLKKLGITYVRIVEGEQKDIGSFFRNPTEEEKKYLKSLIKEIYLDFSSYVLSRRNVTNVSEVLTSKFFIAEEAKRLGLVDDIGDFEKVKEKIARDLNISKNDIIIERFSCKKNENYLKELLGLDLSFPLYPRFQVDLLAPS